MNHSLEIQCLSYTLKRLLLYEPFSSLLSNGTGHQIMIKYFHEYVYHLHIYNVISTEIILIELVNLATLSYVHFNRCMYYDNI